MSVGMYEKNKKSGKQEICTGLEVPAICRYVCL